MEFTWRILSSRQGGTLSIFLEKVNHSFQSVLLLHHTITCTAGSRDIKEKKLINKIHVSFVLIIKYKRLSLHSDLFNKIHYNSIFRHAITTTS